MKTEYASMDRNALIEEIERLSERLEEAKASNVAKEVFLSNMSHDIRTPMNAILGMTALAKKHIDEKTRVTDALNKIETAGGHLLALINDVLDMSRINSGRLVLAHNSFFLSDLIHDVLTIVQPAVKEKKHAFRVQTDHIEAECLVGDALRLRQIFVNIINNAVKYTPKKGNILVGFSEETSGNETELIFVCRDNGVGMTKEFLERIFEPFERVNNSSISGIEGTGLGMSIVKKIVDALGGSIAIESEPGKGTCVTIRLPMAVEKIEVNCSVLKDKRILIIEADEQVRQKYERYLGEYGVSFTLVRGAADALDALTQADHEEKPYHLAVIGEEIENHVTPFEIASYMKKTWPDIPLVLSSREDWSAMEYQAVRAGIQTFIPQPFFRKSLINGLAESLCAAAGQQNASETPRLEGKRLLLVEDNLINMEIAREILASTGAEIDTAEDGRQAVERFLSAQQPYSIILMDLQMPVMDGYEAARAIRSSGAAGADTVPIYAMTANTFAEDIQKAHDSGMNGHIAKPIDVHALMQVLATVR